MGKSLNQAKANAIRYTKKKVEHWQLVPLHWPDTMQFRSLLHFFWHCGFGLTAGIL